MKTISLTVALDKIENDDEIESIINAIKQLKGVNNVTIHEFLFADHMNAWSYKQKWLTELAQGMLDTIIKEKEISR